MKPRTLLMLGATAVAVVSSACAGAAQPTPTPTRAQPTATTAPAQPTAAPQAVVPTPSAALAATPTARPPTPTPAAVMGKKSSGQVRIAVADDIAFMNPLKINENASGAVYGANAHERLSRVVRGGGDLEPSAAEKWEALEGGKVWRYFLRRNVKFQNGEALAADDVKFSIDWGMDPALGAAHRGQLAATFKEGRAVDDFTFDYVLSQVDVSFPYVLSTSGVTYIVPKDYVAQIGREEYANRPIGLGPYQLVERRLNHSYRLEAFEGWHGGVPVIKTIQAFVVPEVTTRIAMLRTGEIDVTLGITPQLANQISKMPGIRVAFDDPTEMRYIALNTPKFVLPDGRKPFEDLRVRLALNYAIDRDAIVNSVYAGAAIPIGAPVVQEWTGYDPNIKAYLYDPARAKQLLAEAGYKDGFPLSIIVPRGGRWVGAENDLLAVVKMYNDVGIRAKAEFLEFSEWLRLYRAFDFQATVSRVGVSTPDPANQIRIVWLTGGPSNRWSIKELDDLILRAGSQTNKQEYAETWRKVFRYLHDNAVDVWTWAVVSNTYAYSDKLKMDPAFQGLEMWDVPPPRN